jgi:hypothetical protein
MKELVVVAIGGNSIIKDNASQSIEHQAEAVKAVADTVLEMLASDYDIVLTHSLGLKSLTIHRCRRFKCASTCHTPPHQLPFMERCGSRRDTRHRLGGTGGVHQHKAGVILRFWPYTLAFFIQRQYIASG